jgi:DNA repair photolyase
MVFITDLSDPAFHVDKVAKALNAGHKVIAITKNPELLITSLIGKVKVTIMLDNLLLQVTVTGLGGSIWEPNVPRYNKVFEFLQNIAPAPVRDVTLRFDPIIPNVNSNPEGIELILDRAKQVGINKVTASVLDLYPHSADRIKAAGCELPFTGFQYGRKHEHLNTIWEIARKLKLDIRFCCEQGFPHGEGGCDWPDSLLSKEELNSMEKGCQRTHCGCPKYRQLLTYKDECSNGCLYCYIKW